MDESRSSVSVVIPTYNAGVYILEAVESVWNQTQPPAEIIVVDDCSTDETPDRVAALADRSKVPLRLIRSVQNSGAPAHPMNIGLDESKSELIAILDQDDIWQPTKLERQGRLLQRRPDLAFVSSLFGYFGRKRFRWPSPRRWRSLLTPSITASLDCYSCDGSTAFDLLVKYENFLGGFPGFMFRKRDWSAKGGFDESLRVAADYDFLCWLCSRGSMGFVDELHYLRREHEHNVTYSEVPRLIDVVRVLTRYLSTEDLETNKQQRYVLGSKILRLAQFFTWCDCREQGHELLNLYWDVCQPPSSKTWRMIHWAIIRTVKPLGSLLGFTDLRTVTPHEAQRAVETVCQIIAEHRGSHEVRQAIGCADS